MQIKRLVLRKIYRSILISIQPTCTLRLVRLHPPAKLIKARCLGVHLHRIGDGQLNALDVFLALTRNEFQLQRSGMVEWNDETASRSGRDGELLQLGAIADDSINIE